MLASLQAPASTLAGSPSPYPCQPPVFARFSHTPRHQWLEFELPFCQKSCVVQALNTDPVGSHGTCPNSKCFGLHRLLGKHYFGAAGSPEHSCPESRACASISTQSRMGMTESACCPEDVQQQTILVMTAQITAVFNTEHAYDFKKSAPVSFSSNTAFRFHVLAQQSAATTPRKHLLQR